MESDADKQGRSGRWARRDRRQRSERARIQKHGASLRRVYLDAVKKRIADRRQRAGK